MNEGWVLGTSLAFSILRLRMSLLGSMWKIRSNERTSRNPKVWVNLSSAGFNADCPTSLFEGCGSRDWLDWTQEKENSENKTFFRRRQTMNKLGKNRCGNPMACDAITRLQVTTQLLFSYPALASTWYPVKPSDIMESCGKVSVWPMRRVKELVE